MSDDTTDAERVLIDLLMPQLLEMSPERRLSLQAKTKETIERLVHMDPELYEQLNAEHIRLCGLPLWEGIE